MTPHRPITDVNRLFEALETRERVIRPAAEAVRFTHPTQTTVGSVLEEGIAKLRAEAKHAGPVPLEGRPSRASRLQQSPIDTLAAELNNRAGQLAQEQDSKWAKYVEQANAPRSR